MNLDDLNDLAPARLPFPVTRAMGEAPALAADGPARMTGHFATFNQPYEVNSSIEGHFMERVAPGAFKKTMAESRGNIKVLFDHGQDPQMGNLILGSIESLSEDRTGAAYDVSTFDGIPPLLMSGLRAGAYGSSFRFSVEKDTWDNSPERSDWNPDGIPERTINEARVFEFGPVTFPANPAATAGVRSTTDTFYQRSRDPESFETLLRSAQVARTPKGAAAEPPGITPVTEPMRSDTPPEPPPTEVATQPADPPNGGSSDSQENRTVSENQYQDPVNRDARIVELESVLKRTAGEQTGVMSTAVQQQWDKDTSELSELRAAKAAYEQRMATLRNLVPDEQRHVDGGAPAVNVIRKMAAEDIYDLAKIRNETRSRDEYDAKVRDHALRSIDAAKISKAAGDLNPLVELIERTEADDVSQKGDTSQRVLLTGSPAYRRYFSKYLAGKHDLASQEERAAAALAVTGTTTTGGYAVPYTFDPTMIRIGTMTPQNPFRQACRTVTLASGNNWRAVTANATTAVYGTEAQPSVESGPTFAQPSYTVQTAQSFVTLSIETMEDRPDITAELTENFAEAKNTLEENKFAVGAGTGVYPMGMFTDTAYTNQDTATNDVTALLDFTVVEGAVPLRYRVNAAWFMARSTIRQLQILDTSYRYFSGAQIQFPGQGLLQVGSTGGGNTGLRLLGYPIWEVPSAVSTLTTDGAIIAVLCDPQTYIIVDRIGMNVEVIPNMTNGATPSFPTLQRGVLAYWRNTAKPHTAASGISLSVQ